MDVVFGKVRKKREQYRSRHRTDDPEARKVGIFELIH
jgi:hypothetical protein